MSEAPEGWSAVVGPDEGGRLDRWLAGRVPSLSRAASMRLIESGRVVVNGKKARKADPVSPGDEVTVRGGLPEAEWSPAPDAAMPLRIVHEDADVVVVDKLAGVPAHPLGPDETGTVANALVARYPEMAGVGYSGREPGLVHRLDTDTSGLLLCARSQAAWTALRDALRAGDIRKEYRALVGGDIASSGRILLAIAPHRKDRKRVEVVPEERRRRRPEARMAETRYEVLSRYGELTLLRVRAAPALRHQIRVHLAAVGHPIAGDTLYGGPPIEGLGRQFLHAETIAFVHPRTRKPIRVKSKLPEDLARALDKVRG
ncbi:MAG: RluA family pseudouridine synthase [Deltaproteobacteria bacterium]|nr:RluA family pseudouridine synthase [Deltaproteobacteria bacterium]